MHINALDLLKEGVVAVGGGAVILRYVCQFAVALWSAYKNKMLASKPAPPDSANAAIQAIVAAEERARVEKDARIALEQKLDIIRQEKTRHEIAEIIRESTSFDNRDDLADLIEKGEIEDAAGHKIVLKSEVRPVSQTLGLPRTGE